MSERAVPPVTLKPDEAAEAIGVSPRTLGDWTARGLVPSIKIGGTRLYSLDALREWARDRSEYDGGGEVRRGKAPKVGNGVGLSAPWGRAMGRSGQRRQPAPRPIRLDGTGGAEDAG